MKKLGRNDPCHCGSGKKYKKCCLAKDEAEARAAHAAEEAERRKALAEQDPAAADAPEETSPSDSKHRSPFKGKGGVWGNDDRAGRTAGSPGRNYGSGHR